MIKSIISMIHHLIFYPNPGLPLCSGAGMYILQLLDNYVASWSIIIICICECFIFTFLYGVDQLLSDMEMMIGYRPNRLWKYFWSIITPVSAEDEIHWQIKTRAVTRAMISGMAAPTWSAKPSLKTQFYFIKWQSYVFKSS